MAEAKVKSYTRRTKSGKTITVKAHSRSCKGEGCSSCSSKKDAGKELENAREAKRKKHPKVSMSEGSALDYSGVFRRKPTTRPKRVATKGTSRTTPIWKQKNVS